MYLNLNDILGYEIQATDKPAGTVEDAYIDDVLWTVRHIAVADAGGLGTQEAMIDPKGSAAIDAKTKCLLVNQTHDQIAGGPDISSDFPVSKQDHEHGDRHLRSIKEIQGYKVFGEDGNVGAIDGFIIDSGEWKIHFIIVQANLDGVHNKVLVGPGLVNHVNFNEKSVHLDLDKNRFAESPAYDPSKPIEHSEDVKLVGRKGI